MVDWEATRKDGNIACAYIIILDGDSSIDLETGEEVKGAPNPSDVHKALKWSNINHCIYTSHSNKEGLHRWRAVIPCDIENVTQLEGAVDYLINKLHKVGVYLAPASENKAWSQAWYFPRIDNHKSPFAHYEHTTGKDFIMPDKCTTLVDALASNLGGVDQILTALEAQGLVKRSEGGKVHILCPWMDEHSEDTKETGTVYFPPSGQNNGQGGFKCCHSHCSERNIVDLRKTLGIGDLENKTGISLPFDEKIFSPEFLFAEDHINWRMTKLDRVFTGLKPTLENTRTLLEAYGIGTAYNVISKEIFYKGFEDKYDINKSTYQGSVLSAIESIMDLNKMPVRSFTQRVAAIAAENEYNPIAEYLGSLSSGSVGSIEALGGVVRLANDQERELFNTMLKLWMIQACAAADASKRTPNQTAIPKYEYTLIFAGGQGAGKTKLFERMTFRVSKYFQSGLHLDFRNKDTILAVVRLWIAELGEMDTTFKRAELSQFKAFSSQTKDAIRVPYGRATEDYIRQTVLCGTVNDTQFLRDETGNRRYWPFHIISIAVDSITDEMVDNAWAEAWQLYLAGEQWWPDAELEKRLDKHRAASEELSEGVLKMIDYFGEDFSDEHMVGATEMNSKEILHACSAIGEFDSLKHGAGAKIDTYLMRHNLDKEGKPRFKNRGNRKIWLMPPQGGTPLEDLEW